MGRGRDTFKAFSGPLSALSKLLGVLPRRARQYLLAFFRDTKGYKGLGIRYALFKTLAEECGDNVGIHPGVYLLNCDGMKIGSNVSIHPMCYFDGYGGLSIGNDVSIAHNVSILTFEHIFSDFKANIKDQGSEKKPVEISNNVWIGAKATILGGSSIGTGSIVGAGAVVTKDVEEYAIVAGVPARLIKKRTP